MRTLVLSTLLAFGLAAVMPTAEVYADEGDDAPSTIERVEALSAEGAQLFQQEDYEGAIEKFEEAYALEPVPNLLYNIGRCYEQLEDWEEARHYFEQFTRSPDVDSDARAHAMERIDNLREIQRAEQEAEETGEDPDTEEMIAETPEDLRQKPQTNYTPAFITTGVGVSLIGAGVMTGVLARGNAGRIDNTGLEYAERVDARDTARTQALMADIFYVAGALATGAGIYLLMTAGPDDDAVDVDQPPRAGIFPRFSADEVGLGLIFDF